MIPKWNNGILPPIRPGMSAHSHERSPYLVSICDIVESFSYTEKRKQILKGLLLYRRQLYNAGIVSGFQWIDGSFMEDIEMLENREPNDIDVITFFYLPEGIGQQDLYNQHTSLFELETAKHKHHVDGHFFQLGEKTDKSHVRLITYWYSMWSHRRNGHWKGFLRVELSSGDDKLAAQILN